MNDNIKSKFTLRSLINNNKFVFFFSLAVSFALWLWISIEKSPVVETTVLSVPVQINLEDSIPGQLGLQVFGNDNYTVDVTVVGKKFVVGSLTADDIRVIAQTSFVDSAGTKTLPLKATIINGKDFEITALSQNYISVFFDSLKEFSFPIEPNIISKVDNVVPDDLILGTAVFSSGTILVSGPATEVNNITGVTADYVLEETLTKTTTVTPEIKFVGAKASELTYTKIDTNSSVITMTLPVLKSVTLPTVVTLRNAPADYLDESFKKNVTPSKIKVEIPVEKIGQITEVVVGTVDFNKLTEGTNVFKFDAKDVSDFVLINENQQFECSITIVDVDEKTVSIPTNSIKLENRKSDYSYEIVEDRINDIKIIGPKADIENISSDNVSAVADLSQVDISEGKLIVPIIITVNYSTSCWASGEYKITVSCEKNN